MAVVGLGITTREKEKGTLYAEYHKCDNCGTEFRLYYKNSLALKEAVEAIGRRLRVNGKEDLCHTCQFQVEADQLIMPLDSE